MDEMLQESTLRFLEAMNHPVEAQSLGASLVQGIYYRIIAGAQGGSMRAAPNRPGHFGKVTRAIRKIRSRYRERLDVEALAQEASMSVRNFHLHFRTVTDSSPMQCLKSTRLR